MTVAAVKRFTVEDYHRLIELGFLTEGDRLELIRGELIEMASKGDKVVAKNTELTAKWEKIHRDTGGDLA